MPWPLFQLTVPQGSTQPPSWRLQTAMTSFWETLVWSHPSLQMSGCALTNSLVSVPSVSGWYWRGSSPSWSPWSVEPGQSWLHYSFWHESEEWGDSANGYPHPRWGRWGEAWNGDHLLTLQPGKGEAFGHASDLCSVGFTWAHCGGDENLHFSVLPMGIIQPLFSWHSHPARGCPNHSISTFMAVLVPVTSIFFHPCNLSQEGEEGKWAKDHPNHLGDIMRELNQRAPPIIFGAALSPRYIPHHLQGNGCTDWWKTGCQHGS